MSAGQKSRHIHIRYFFMKDRIKTEKIKIVHCPTLEMLADFFTKPLQGQLFRKFRAVVMGEAHTSTLKSPSAVPTEERVEENTESVPTGQTKGSVSFDLAGRTTGQKAMRTTYASILKPTTYASSDSVLVANHPKARTGISERPWISPHSNEIGNSLIRV